jgi:dihydrofolate reductase
MRPLRYSINVTVDGCADHKAGMVSPETHRHSEEGVARADALILGRTTYELMEFWRPFAQPDAKIPDGMPPWMLSFAPVIDQAKKYVVSSTLAGVDWNAELIRGDLEKTVRALKEQPGNGLATGGLTLPLALAEMGLIDEYEFIVQPRLAGHGPYVFAGLSKFVDLKLVERIELGAAVALRYVPK